MVKYDFESYHNRKNTCASKWEQMYARKPDVGEGVVPMTVADMDFMTAPEIRQAICEYAERELLGYSRPTKSYLEAVVSHYEKNFGYKARPEWIFTMPGVVPALATAVRAFSKPGNKVIIMSPVYGPFYDVVKGQDRELLVCPLVIKDGCYEIDFDRFEACCAAESAKVFLLCSPHNPSGRVWTREELLRLSDICEKHGIVVVSDEIHSDIVHGENPHLVFNTISPYAARAVLCTSPGKTFNIQALQTANVFIEDAAQYKAFERASVDSGIERANVLGMVATAAAYREGGPWKEAMLAVIRRNLELVRDFFAPYAPALVCMPVEAGFLAWVDFSGLGVSHRAFMDFLSDCDFFVTDGLFFGDNGEHHFRVNVGLPTRALEENLKRLKAGLMKHFNL